MSTINGNVCVVNGNAVDKVFSNDRQVYGRNLFLKSKALNIEQLSSSDIASVATSQNQNMNNWIWSDPAKSATSITYANGVNTIDYTGVSEYETFNMPIHAKIGDKVSVTFAYTQPSVFSLDGSSNGVLVSFFDYPLEGEEKGTNPMYLGVNAQSSKVYTISTKATSETIYLSFNFGYLSDGINWKFELSVQQDVPTKLAADVIYVPFGSATVTVEPFDSATNMWHIVSKQGNASVAGMFILNCDRGEIPDNSDWSYSADVKGTGKIYKFGIEDSSKNPLIGTVGSEWSRISQTGHFDKTGQKTIVMYFDSNSSPVDVYIKLPKLETGKISTPWTPVPEDVLK